MNQKLLFFDIDGTLLTEDIPHIVPESTKEAITKARSNGHLAFINTGRTCCNLDRKVMEIGFDGCICGCGTYIQLGDKILLKQSIPHKVRRELVNMLRKCKVEAVLEGQEDIYFDCQEEPSENMKSLKDELNQGGFGLKKDWDDETIVFDKFYSISSDKSDMDTFLKYLKQDFDYIDRGKGCGEIVPKNFSKGTGIGFLLDYLNLPLENAYAFGDSTNDLPMLEYVKHSVAMGNAVSEVKEKAFFITEDIHKDGIWYALKHFRII